MRKAALVLAAVALTACSVHEESHGEVVDTLIDNSNVSVVGLDSTTDTSRVPTLGTDTGVLKKPAVTGRKPVDMKDSVRRPQ